jgi:hypothetical protein
MNAFGSSWLSQWLSILCMRSTALSSLIWLARFCRLNILLNSPRCAIFSKHKSSPGAYRHACVFYLFHLVSPKESIPESRLREAAIV